MIKIVGEKDVSAFLSFCKNSAAGCRISSSFYAYGAETPFHRIWLYYSEEFPHKLSGVIGKTDGAVTVCCKENELPDEIAEFINMQPDVSEILYEKDNDRNIVMRLKALNKSLSNSAVIVKNGEARDVYSVIKWCEGFDIKTGDELYVDISHQIRHGCLKCKVIFAENKAVSSACAHISGNDALVTAVATLPDFRRSGYGGLAAAALCNDLKDKNIFLMCKSELKEFYQNIGFEKSGGYIIESGLF